MFLHGESWAWCLDRTVVSWIEEGYRIPFKSLPPPPPSRTPLPFRFPRRERRTLLLQELDALVQKEANWQVSESELNHAAFYASMFLVPKPNGTFRPRQDMRDGSSGSVVSLRVAMAAMVHLSCGAVRDTHSESPP